MIKLYTQIALTEDIPAYGLKKGDTAMVIEHYPMPEGQEDGYSLEGFDIPIPGITLEVKASQIQPTNYNFDGFTINLYMDEQEEWLAHFQEMPNISAFGDTPQEALEELKTAWELTKEYYLAQDLCYTINRNLKERS